MRLLHLHWPHLLIRLARDRSSDPFPVEPIVLGGKPWMPGYVLDASLSALELGVRVGMPLGTAHRMAPEAMFLEPDREADEAALAAALEILGGLSPGIVAETEVDAPGFGRIEIQLDGLERLWGPEPQIVERAASLLGGVLPGTPLAGIGGTRFVAAVAASVAGRVAATPAAANPAADRRPATAAGQPAADRAAAQSPAQSPATGPATHRPAASVAARQRVTAPSGPGPAPSSVSAAGREKGERVRLECVEPRTDAEFLAPLPSSLLSRSPDVRGRLERFGLRTIGSVAELPRSAVVARFGPEGERIHARARGEETDAFRPRRAPERLAMSLPIDPPVADVEGIRFVLHRIAAVFGDQLEARGAATARVRLTLELDRTFVAGDVPPALLFDQRLPEPTSEVLAIERLLVARLEVSTLPAPVSRLGLELLDVAPAAGRQLTIFTPQAGRTGRLGWQLVRLGLRFGEDRVGWVELDDVEAPLAEERWRWRPQSGLAAGSPSTGSPSAAGSGPPAAAGPGSPSAAGWKDRRRTR